jgi:hypothetical protein
LPTNLGIHQGREETWRPLVEGIHEIFAAGHSDKAMLETNPQRIV